MQSGEWRVKSGLWRMECGEWRMDIGEESGIESGFDTGKESEAIFIESLPFLSFCISIIFLLRFYNLTMVRYIHLFILPSRTSVF